MKSALLTVIAATTALAFATPVSAAVLIADGITYDLTLDSITNGGLTGNFTLDISGINTASDTEGGRTGINAFALNDPSIGTAIDGSASGFVFTSGGLNANGCDGSGNFFCFDNPSIPPIPGALLGDSLTLMFSVTSDTVGSWDAYDNPDFKIDWVGSQNNYDLVSLGIPVNGAIPEPATWAMMIIGFGAAGYSIRRRRKALLTQVA
jgi:PEP-CTERM motif